MIADQIGIDKMIVHTTENLVMQKIWSKLLVLTDDQKQRNEASKFRMAHCIITSSKKGSNEQIQMSLAHHFFYAKGVVHYEFVPEGQAVNGAFYLEVLRRLKRRVNRVRPAIARNWKLHYDNAPNHTCSKVTDYLTQNGHATILQPPYMKSSLKGHHHRTLSAVKEVCLNTIKDLPGSHQHVEKPLAKVCRRSRDVL
ncbi:hypothetical protein J437_LFUL018967 [Ladona fulva]|uniref:Transposase n=1 Tax=Ladona fulva TaxID=123851 RepID=A0A8K0KR44_LADFU|nr:hypothetical protein J437_LFUL018967 [Ladona fulva]